MLEEARVHLGFLCGWPYTQRADRPGRPVEVLCAPVMAGARYAGRPVYFTDVIVRRDAPWRTFADLRGRSYAYNDPGSHSGYNVPRDHLLHLGETGGYFGRVVESGAHQSSIRMIAAGEVDAAGIDSTVLELELRSHPELAGTFRVVEAIGPNPIPPVVVPRALDAALKAGLRELLLGMHADAEGRVVLEAGLVARFAEVGDADYEPVRAMVRRARAAGFLALA
jgi:phosphonate transport system substrate-binding protein